MKKKDILASSKKIRRKRLLLKYMVISFCFLAVATGMVKLFYLSKFRVQKISIKGNIVLKEEEIKLKVLDSINGKYFHIFPEDNILIIPKKKIAENLLSGFPRLKKVSLAIDMPDILFLEIKERKPAALFCQGENCAFLDEDGFVFEKSPFFSDGVFLKFFDERETVDKKLSFQLISEIQYKKLIEFAEFVSKENIKIYKIILEKNELYKLYTSETWYIILNSENDPRAAFENLKTALGEQIKDKREKLEYIDLRLENKIFYKYYYTIPEPLL
jgi:cell division septal protein FtsQ